jgi:hypothetical protein
MSDIVTTAYGAALDGMQRLGPRALHDLAAMFGDPGLRDGTALAAHLRTAGPDDALRKQFAHTLAGWDHADTDAAWTGGTTRNTAARRAAINFALAVDSPTTELFTDLFPVAEPDGTIVIADSWEEWRTAQRRADHDHYWRHYRDYLLAKGWDPDAVAGLDNATEEVVRRLSDPTRNQPYQAKGLVVGYVQSGKTANFTGVAAKAVDAGYRLVIVLTGTTNMLRSQTQRRLDMELCGRENLEREISPHDRKGHDYQDDPEWRADRFIRHGGRPSDSGYPDIHRLSNHAGDYRRLRQGFAALEFERRERNRRFHDPVNLFTSNARLVVAKKNPTVLKDLVADLGRITDRLGEVPVLIIDDESDQASINTTSPKKWKADSRERTVINRLIGQLLTMMPRAQYVGYTATPYANVFIDPSDVQDIFPRDFLISLQRPTGYMGPEDFHDFDTDIPRADRLLATSKERAHVRDLSDEHDDVELREALDMYLLTGAVKIHRERMGAATFRHHTMLVHEAMGRDVHRDAASLINHLWRSGAYHTPAGLQRLRNLYDSDVLPVSRAVGSGPTPDSFDDLRADLAEALRRINPPDRDTGPVIVVNSDKDLERLQESLDFDKRRIWRILVGGNKLARGFTVEGLTVSYYRRATAQVDTLMQMGRWFGFRPGYRDLVRLYTTPDLHDMFAAACLDEEFLRRELRQYARPAPDGTHLTPRQVPPLIAQHRPDLRPSAHNKMWNAKLLTKASPGASMEPVAYPKAVSTMRANLERWLPVLDAATRTVRFNVPATRTSYEARVTAIGHKDLLAVLTQLDWLTPDTFQPELNWLRGLASGQLERWIVILPYQVRSTTKRTVLDRGPYSIFERKRQETGSFAAFSESRHRNAAQRIVGLATDYPDPVADSYNDGKTAALVLYPVVEKGALAGEANDPIDPNMVTMACHFVTPWSAAPRDGKLITWQTIDSSNPTAIVVESRA